MAILKKIIFLYITLQIKKPLHQRKERRSAEVQVLKSIQNLEKMLQCSYPTLKHQFLSQKANFVGLKYQILLWESHRFYRLCDLEEIDGEGVKEVEAGDRREEDGAGKNNIGKLKKRECRKKDKSFLSNLSKDKCSGNHKKSLTWKFNSMQQNSEVVMH